MEFEPKFAEKDLGILHGWMNKIDIGCVFDINCNLQNVG
jgi:hypothetical protein